MKKIGKLLFLVIIVAGIFLGKKFIDDYAMDNSDVINDSLKKYYVSGLASDLEPILDLLDKYSSIDSKKQDIQVTAVEYIDDWYNYVQLKFLCDTSNLNTCSTQLDEVDLIEQRIETLYNTRTGDGITIILPSHYQALVTKVSQIKEKITDVTDSYRSKNASTSEDIRLERCSEVNLSNCSCSSNSNYCTCSYIDEDKNSFMIYCENTDTDDEE